MRALIPVLCTLAGCAVGCLVGLHIEARRFARLYWRTAPRIATYSPPTIKELS